MTVKHKNIVRFLGFCANTENIPWKDPKSSNYVRYIYPERRERLLCFEYVGNGALDNHITGMTTHLECDVFVSFIS